MSLPSPCGSECSTNTLVSCMSSLPLDPQSPQSPSRHLPGIPNSIPAPGMNPAISQVEGDTFTVPPPLPGPGWDALAHCEVDRGTRTSKTQANSMAGTVTTSLANSGSGLSKTSCSSGVLGEMDSLPKLSESSNTHSSISGSSHGVETPLVRTSDLSDHSDGSDETVTSESRRCSRTEEK